MPEILGKPKAFYDTFVRKGSKDLINTHYCPGCGHGRIHKLIAEAMDKLEIADRCILISPVGCSVFAYYYFDCGNIQSAHGRAPAVATGASRANPGSILISYQGDGDLAGIGGNEIIQAANRGENMTVIFVNNAIYGMTGGQMAPTTLIGQKTATTPYGRNANNEGNPIRMAELISTLEAPVFVERAAVSDIKHIHKARKAIYKALKAQKDGQGFSFVEILSPCPTAWRLQPAEAIKWLEENMMPYFELKTFKDETETRPPKDMKKPHLNTVDEYFQALNLPESEDPKKANAEFVKKFTEQQIRIAGFGGQGVLVAGITIATLAMEEGLEVSWLPSYGPEMRGGTANCHVVLSNKQIGSPLVTSPNVLIAMNGPSLDEFEESVQKNGLIIVNSSLVDRKVKRMDVKAIYAPVTEMASSSGLTAAANMVVLGVYLAYTKVIPPEKLFEVIKKHLKKKALIDQNIEAVKKGIEFIQK